MTTSGCGNASNVELSADQFPLARSYQIEALEQAIKQNTIVYLETGSGKTLIAIMLLRRYAHLLRKPSPFISVFLVPTVVLVKQQAEAVRKHIDLQVGEYWGEKCIDLWKAAEWKKQLDENELMVMTPAILLDALRHKFLSLDIIKVLIFDECHNAKRNHPYALIMKEFYHRQLCDNGSQLPRILGMTASPVKAKGSSAESYWKQINKLENLMNSKVYTCASESVLAEYIPFSTAKYRFYKNLELPAHVLERLKSQLSLLRQKHESIIRKSDLSASSTEYAMRRLAKLSSTFEFCMYELGIWLALKAAETFSCESNDILSWGKLDVRGKTIARDFCEDARKLLSSFVPDGPEWLFTHVNGEGVNCGFFSAKVVCLIESLSEYSHLNDMRCIIFVERVITAVVLKILLCELHPILSGWKTEYTAGGYGSIQSQSRGVQNKIVDEFRNERVNIIVATSILEEGLDVQSCNLVIRFDLAATVCSFIQSRGRARMQDSEFLVMVRSGDEETISKVNNYLLSGQIMRDQSLLHASQPCDPLDREIDEEVFYQVESTGATLNLSSSVSMVYFYCSRLPSDGYFKPYPRFVIDEEAGTCILYFPKSSPLPQVSVSGNLKMLKQLACLEACKQLHMMGALTDNLVPVDKAVEVEEEEAAFEYIEEQAQYMPPELIGQFGNGSTKLYHFYSIKLKKHFDYDIPLQDIMIGVSSELELDEEGLSFDLEAGRGIIAVSMTYTGTCMLTSDQIKLANQFQVTVLRLLLDHTVTKLVKFFKASKGQNDHVVRDYLLLPSNGLHSVIDWTSVRSVMFPFEGVGSKHKNVSLSCDNHHQVHTQNGLVCSCLVENALVCTPHNGRLYCTTKRLVGLNGESSMQIRDEEVITYKEYYKTRHDIDLQFEEDSFFAARPIFVVRNCLHRGRYRKEKESCSVRVELPSQLCYIIMSPISISTLYSYSFVPSIMHRIESWLIACNLKKMHLVHDWSHGKIPSLKVLEAITTKKCLESFHLESFETLGDSFLKYAASQHLFKTFQEQHEGFLSLRREKLVSNDSLCRLGCTRHLPGFIRDEPFNPRTWVVPGDHGGSLEEVVLSTERKVYICKKRIIKKKVVADVVEALIGVLLIEGGEMAALSFMGSIGLEFNFVNTPYRRDLTLQPERFLNIKSLESLLCYSFRDTSLLVEALTHGSYMLPEIPKCYQRLEFLGDAVLDYLITAHLYNKYPGLSPGMLTELRSASVNNDCYAQSAVKVELHKHILHGSQDLHRHIVSTINNFDHTSVASTFGWESETAFPKVLGDIVESLAGAILVDSGYDKDTVFKSIRPLLEPLVTPETLKWNPVKELQDICDKKHYKIKKRAKRGHDGTVSFTVEVEADNVVVYKDTSEAMDKKMAERCASKSVLRSLKTSLSL